MTGLSLQRILAWPAILLVKGYRYLISPWLGTNCRFEPSCSEYAVEALTRHGIIKGAWLSMVRILRCNPWGGAGYDPVPVSTRESSAVQLTSAVNGPSHLRAHHGCDHGRELHQHNCAS